MSDDRSPTVTFSKEAYADAFVWFVVPSWANFKEMPQIPLPVLTGFLGSAGGFYFGTRVRD